MDLSDLDGSFAFKLHRATVLVDRLADDYLRGEHGLGYAHFVVLLMTGILEPTSQRAIADNLGVSRASVTQRLAGLDGLVTVEPDPADARSNLVRLTPLGRERLERAWDGLEHRRDGLDEGVDTAALARELDTLIANALHAIRSAS